MRLSANSRRPARRSNDGQAILDSLSATQEVGSDLRFCGAPLRNRTVDLLLTIANFPGSLPDSAARQANGSTNLTLSRPAIAHCDTLMP